MKSSSILTSLAPSQYPPFDTQWPTETDEHHDQEVKSTTVGSHEFFREPGELCGSQIASHDCAGPMSQGDFEEFMSTAKTLLQQSDLSAQDKEVAHTYTVSESEEFLAALILSGLQ